MNSQLIRSVMIMIYILGILSLVTFILFGVDKRRAVKHRWRISEGTLLIFSLFGGIGGLLGMICFHHKTRKWKFRILVPLFAVLDAMLIVFLLYMSSYYPAEGLVTGRYSEIVLGGGNHAQFGNYGTQSGDGTAKITVQEQQERTVEEIGNFFSH